MNALSFSPHAALGPTFESPSGCPGRPSFQMSQPSNEDLDRLAAEMTRARRAAAQEEKDRKEALENVRVVADGRFAAIEEELRSKLAVDRANNDMDCMNRGLFNSTVRTSGNHRLVTKFVRQLLNARVSTILEAYAAGSIELDRSAELYLSQELSRVAHRERERELTEVKDESDRLGYSFDSSGSLSNAIHRDAGSALSHAARFAATEIAAAKLARFAGRPPVPPLPVYRPPPVAVTQPNADHPVKSSVSPPSVFRRGRRIIITLAERSPENCITGPDLCRVINKRWPTENITDETLRTAITKLRRTHPIHNVPKQGYSLAVDSPWRRMQLQGD